MGSRFSPETASRLFGVAALPLAFLGVILYTWPSLDPVPFIKFVLGDEARLGCAVDARPDPAYAARMVGDLETEETDYEVLVTRDGKPVSGAKVCADLGMGRGDGEGHSTGNWGAASAASH